MSEFCLQCSKRLGAPEGWSDFEKIVEEGITTEVLCEGCGYIRVDHNGRCLTHPNCDKVTEK